MALRNEDYVAFLDESGETNLQVVTGLLIPARWLRGAERRWKDFIRHHLGSNSGRREIHARELVRGEGAAYQAQAAWIRNNGQPISAGAAGRQFYKDALEHIAGIAQLRVVTVGMNTRHSVDAYRLWFWLTYAALIVRPRAPRPRLALVVIDGEDAGFRDSHDLIAHRFYGSFWERQPYIQRGKPWFIGGSVHQKSDLLPFIQMADLVAFCARHAMANRQRYGGWYDTHLRQFALDLNPRRDIDVSAHALAQLRRRSPKDTCGSGYANALIIP